MSVCVSQSACCQHRFLSQSQLCLAARTLMCIYILKMLLKKTVVAQNRVLAPQLPHPSGPAHFYSDYLNIFVVNSSLACNVNLTESATLAHISCNIYSFHLKWMENITPPPSHTHTHFRCRECVKPKVFV